ncbi:MAG: HAMP domain-containing histidine kinase, partial [Clostridium sp.]|nr:HAMP domain-containing histidine kinase [Clostridium sp.]
AGFSDGILDGTIPPEKQKECLQVISDETRRLNRLVRRMLDMSQRSAKEQSDLCQSQLNGVETFAQVLISLERKITSRGLDVDVNFPDKDVMVWGDLDSITQVCYNLMDNAIKFATPGTVIGVSIVPKGNKAWFSVRNTGETIPPEELNMIFDRFHKSDRSRSLDKEGVGLGLYIVKTILNNHKETITVTSENGVTEFRFSLTLAE